MDNTELLFFDTFAHDVSETELNLDLVQFPKPVFISEVRIIPLGARVKADFPGGVRLGATNPSQFEIEFFVNDLSKPGPSTFESLGGLEYKQNVHIQLECERKHLPTDGLVLRGWYKAITLAVYGTLTKVLSNIQEIAPPLQPTPTVPVKEEVPVPAPEPPPEWFYENQTHATVPEKPIATPPPVLVPVTVTEPAKPPIEPPKPETPPPAPRKGTKRPSSPPSESLVSLSPESISAEEEEAEREVIESEAIEPFEPILSDEDIMADEPSAVDYEREAQLAEELYAINPPNLINIETLSLNVFEEKLDSIAVEKLRDTIQSLAKSVTNFSNSTGQEKETFVHNCESLSATLSKFECDTSDVKNLSDIVETGLNVELACSQPQPAYKVRHVKVGVRLAEALCRLQTGPEILLKVNAPQKLLSLCMRENVALPVKLAAIRALDAALISPAIVEEFLKVNSDLYRSALTMLDTAKLVRLKYALSSLLRKVHVYDSLSGELSEIVLSELTSAYMYSPTLMAQPKRQLPASAQMEFDREHTRNPRKHLIVYFEHHNLAKRLLLILCSPESKTNLIKVTRRLLSRLSNSREGLLYLLKDAEVTKSLLKALRYEEPGIGANLAWQLQVVQCLIQCATSNSWIPVKKLHSFLVYPEGTRAIITVLPMGNFLDILIPCLYDNDLCEFASEIITTIVKYSDEVEVFQNRAALLLDQARNQSSLREVSSFLSVAAQSSSWNYGDVSSLVAIIRKNSEKAATLPGDLITACRILHRLVFPSNDDIDPMEPYVELKHRNALTQLFAADGLTALMAVMTNVTRFYELPSMYRASLTGRRRLGLISLLLPCAKLTRVLLERLVKCMAIGFKDLTAVVPLLCVYCLVHAIPATKSSNILSEEIVETLLVFTNAVDSDGSGNVAKSLWTQMLGEVLKMVSSSPANFVPGLKLLARLLPPILTSKDLRRDSRRALGLRKLWSAHLQAQAGSLTETLRLLCASWNKELLMLVSIVCKQLSDLAAPTALLVGRCLLDGVLSGNPLESNVPILALVGDLARHAPTKATILTLTSPASRAQVKSDQKYPPVIEMMCTALRNTTNAVVQREILDIFETLCDYKLSLVQEDETENSVEKNLSHSVPSKEPLLTIVAAVIEILTSAPKYPLDLVETALRILSSLISHNYGLYHVKSCLENNPDALRSLLEHVASLEKSDEESDPTLAEPTIAFLDSLISSKMPERSLHLKMSQLSTLLSWEKGNHPLEKIRRAAELVEALQVLEEKEEKEPVPEMLEPLLKTPEALLNQFAQRCPADSSEPKEKKARLSLIEAIEDRMNNTVDLLGLVTELLPANFDLLAAAQQVISKMLPDDVTQGKGQNDDQESRDAQQKQNAVPAAKTKQPFITPMRGRNQFANSMRGGSGGGGVGRGADPFRSRPPNTSRPPSLHVDDFVALETCGAQPTGPTGYNKLSIRGSCPPRGVISGSRSRPWVPETRPYLR